MSDAFKVIRIDSLDDPRVELYRNVRDADLRGRDGVFLAESELVIRRLLRTPRRIHSLLLSPNKLARMHDALESLPGAGAGVGVGTTPVYVAELPLMTAIAGFRIHRGALAAGLRPSAAELSLDAALGRLRGRERIHLIIAEGVTNVDNLGGLFRNAAAFGMDGIMLDPTCCDPLYRKSIRVSMGHALSVPHARSAQWLDDLARLKREWGLTLIAAETGPRARLLWEMPKPERVGVLVGSEGWGVSPPALKLCDAVCQIPMSDAATSLNVSVAAAVVLYELLRPA